MGLFYLEASEQNGRVPAERKKNGVIALLLHRVRVGFRTFFYLTVSM